MIHPSAIINTDAHLAQDVSVGPFAVIGPGVVLGEGCRVGAHVVLEGPMEVGRDCLFAPFACVGTPPQDLKYAGEPTSVRLGDRCRIREFVTIHRGTVEGGGETRVGSDVLVMAYAHIAHDCTLGDRVVLANNTTLAGHVHIASDVTTGGMVAFHQFVRVGRHAFIAAGAMVERDVPPFCKVFGDRARLAGLNTVGLRRKGFDPGVRRQIGEAYRALFRRDQPLEEALEEAAERWSDAALVIEMIDFIRESTRGICR